ncbi:MAG: N-acetylmuramoyl-L-alanine amidase [Gemmatimonadaceae bacterium]|nr:N-acetylmuramoyl-L-alanine amidase [Gemmatimonadaceae bacterium]
MIALVAAFALLQQVAEPPATLTVREGEKVGTVPVVVTRLGAMVRAQDLLQTLGAVLLRDTPERYRVVIGGTEFEFAPGLTYTRVKGATEPLAAAPAVLNGTLYLPLSFLTDVVPRVATGFLYDARQGELRKFSPVVAQRRLPNDSAENRTELLSRATDQPPRGERAPRPAGGAPRLDRAPVVIVDAGHGGRDRGMHGPIAGGPRVYEADITLSVARRLRDELKARGVVVVMTRSTDTLIALGDRGRIANRSQGDLFVSIHVNAANPRWKNPGAARGFETYFLSEAKTDDERRVAELENEAVKYEVEEGAQGGDPLSFILNDMKQNEYLRESSDLAATVQRSLRAIHPGTDRGVKQAGFVVLVGAFMPSVLVEVGFGTNAAEAAYMSGATGQGALASAIADATMGYLARYATKRGNGVRP